MKNLRSIFDSKLSALSHPKVLEAQQELQGLWKESYHSPNVIWYMLAGLIGLLFMLIKWSLVQYRVEAEYKEQITVLQQQAQHKPAISIQLTGERLFGEPLSYSAQQALSHAFHLEGILFSDKPQNRSAVIKDESGQVKFYHEGDTLPGGAKLVKINQEHIEIEAQGFHQQLKLEQYPASFLSEQPLNSGPHLLSE